MNEIAKIRTGDEAQAPDVLPHNIEAEQQRQQMLVSVLRIALDPNDDRITAHEEECCGVVLDTWTVDLADFGLGANDDGQWLNCMACGKTGRHYRADGFGFCIRSIAGAKPSQSA